MTTDHDCIVAANHWNCMQLDWLINKMESYMRNLECLETLGQKAKEAIDDMITELECLKSDYRMEE